MELFFLRALFSVFIFICTLVSGCSVDTDREATPTVTTEAFYLPDATLSSVGVDRTYDTVESFQFVVPKEWLVLQSTELISVDEGGRRIEIPNNLESRILGELDESELVFIARQFNLTDPVLLVSLSLTPKVSGDGETQQRLREYVQSSDYLSDTEQFRNHVLGPLERKPDLIDYSWVDGGAKRYGDWLCLFHEVEMQWANGTEQIYSLITCPAGARSIRVAALISLKNVDAVRGQISRFVGSMDVSSTDWAEALSETASER